LDLSDTSESNSLAEMERVLENMPEALDLMRQVDKMEKDLRFYGSQLRDGKDMLYNRKYQLIMFFLGVRGIKRDINFAVANLCQLQMCQKFLISSNIEHIDTSQCLHFDGVRLKLILGRHILYLKPVYSCPTLRPLLLEWRI